MLADFCVGGLLFSGLQQALGYIGRSMRRAECVTGPFIHVCLARFETNERTRLVKPPERVREHGSCQMITSPVPPCGISNLQSVEHSRTAIYRYPQLKTASSYFPPRIPSPSFFDNLPTVILHLL
ncbi:hypothetical protein F5Y12DRAFT_749174 [Xylaria sp. FL1777]|nr:hypothetical protein F5Y12DRAFT_749174 [Xylaria sp. FL1777]